MATPSHSPSASSTGTVAGLRPAVELLALAAVALVGALSGPYEVVVFGLLVVGVTHIALELRYVYGRHRSLFTPRVLAALQVGLVSIAVLRLAGNGQARAVEVIAVSCLCAAAVVAAGVITPAAGRGAILLLGLGSGLLVWALTNLDGWFVAQAHLHNILPFLFLWAWSAELDSAARRGVRTACAVCAAAIPLVLLTTSLAQRSAAPRGATLGTLDRDSIMGAVAPNGLSGSLSERLLVLFAFTQLLHYGIWCWYMPRHAPDAVTSFESTAPGRMLRGPRLWFLAGAVTTIVVALAWTEYRSGRSLYGALGAYHAYLEYPVVALLALGWLTRRRNDGVTIDRG